MQVRIAVGEEPHFEVVEERRQARLGIDDRRDRDHRAIRHRDARAQVELWQLPRAHLRGDDQVDQADGQLAQRQQHHERRDPELDGDAAVAVRVGDEAGHRERRDAGDRAEIAEHRMTVEEAREPVAQRGRIAHFLFEPEAPSRDQVVADVMGAVVLRSGPLRVGCQFHRAARDVLLRRLGATGELLDGVAVAVARREIHARVRARGIFAEDLLDQADALEEDRPLDRRQQPHRRDDVRDRQLAGGLALVLDAQHLFRGVVLGFERALQRVPRRRGRRRLIAQPVEQLDDERRREPAARGRFVAQHLVDDAIGLARAGVQLHAPLARAVAAAARRDDIGGEAAQLLDQRQAQHDRDGPDFADGQRRDALIRGRKVDERLQVEPARGVRDELARERVDARIAGQRTVGQLGQLQVVVPRQVLTDLAEPDPARRDGCPAASLPSRPPAHPS